MRITEAQLRRIIISVLLESKNNSKIEELLERFKSEVEKGEDLFFIITNKFPVIKVTLSKKDRIFYNDLCIVAFESSDNNKVAYKVSGSGPKEINAFTCCGSDTVTGNNLNIGPLLYEIAMEYISFKYKCAVMPDNKHEYAKQMNKDAVSADAYNVWEKYLERSQNEKEIAEYQFDLSQEEINNYNEKNSEASVEQVTPNDDKDDLNLSLSLIKKRGKEVEGKSWSESPLTKAFYKKNGRLIKYLYNNPIAGKRRIIEKI